LKNFAEDKGSDMFKRYAVALQIEALGNMCVDYYLNLRQYQWQSKEFKGGYAERR
jgi:hypothetical protein